MGTGKVVSSGHSTQKPGNKLINSVDSGSLSEYRQSGIMPFFSRAQFLLDSGQSVQDRARKE